MASVDNDGALVAQLAQVAGKRLRRHADARRDHFLAGLELDRRLARQFSTVPRQFEQVIEQALGTGHAVMVAGDARFAGALLACQRRDHTEAQVIVFLDHITQLAHVDGDQQGPVIPVQVDA